MIDLFSSIPDVCRNDFDLCLSESKIIIGGDNINDILSSDGIGETGFNNGSSILCFLNDILTNLSVTYSFNNDDLAEIYSYIVSKGGFVVDCRNDSIFMGGIDAYFKYAEAIKSLNVVYPPAECAGVVYTNVSKCVDDICQPDNSCVNGLTYFFNELDSLLPFESYLSLLTESLNSGISIYNPGLEIPICCPDCGYYLLSGVETSLKFFDGTGRPNICCLNEATTSESYLKLVEGLGDLYEGNYPKVCCNEFEPCLPQFEQDFSIQIFNDGVIETPYYNNHSNLCILTDIVISLPYTLDEKNQIIKTILRQGLVIWCCYDDVFMSSASLYNKWLNSGGCIGPRICFRITDSENTSRCSVLPMGEYNGRPYYPATLTDGSCDVYGGYYVYYSIINSRWELGDEVEGGTTVFSYLPNGSVTFPISESPSNEWIQISEDQKLFMLTSLMGPCD
jgi:hypothetical protein